MWVVFAKVLGLPKISRCVAYLLKINEKFWHYCVGIYMWIMNGNTTVVFSSRIDACLEILDITICTMQLSHGTATVIQTDSDLIHFHNKSNAFGNHWAYPIYGKIAVIWETPVLHSGPSFFHPKRQLGQAAPLAPLRVALPAFPFCFWE